MSDESWDIEKYLVFFQDIPAYTGPVVGMQLPRKVFMVQQFFFEAISKEIITCLQNEAELAAMLLCLVTVDYFAGYYSGRQSTREDYLNYLRDYFPKKYVPFNEFIYDQMRCGLLHNLAAINPWRNKNAKSFRFHKKITPHLEESISDDGRAIIDFSVPIFFEDLKRAFIMYTHDVIMADPTKNEIQKKFTKRFNKLEGRGSVMIKTDE